ncbi:MAG TPA: hypothetical protein VFL76_08870 [Edaphocola sp.]|nr:hypothetical protein [Edaphocola sp.]
MQRFNDKFALITGGTNGMGFATAQQFISENGKAIAVLFLASPEASFIHGTELTVDAGISVIR